MGIDTGHIGGVGDKQIDMKVAETGSNRSYFGCSGLGRPWDYLHRSSRHAHGNGLPLCYAT